MTPKLRTALVGSLVAAFLIALAPPLATPAQAHRTGYRHRHPRVRRAIVLGTAVALATPLIIAGHEMNLKLDLEGDESKAKNE